MSIKAVVLDIDGTLTNDEKMISPRTREALLQIQSEGVKVILASARSEQGMRNQSSELMMDQFGGYLISYSGARIVDARTKEVISSRQMNREVAGRLMDHLRKFDVITWVASGDYMYVEDVFNNRVSWGGVSRNILEYERNACGLLLCEVENLLDVFNHPQNKILATGDDVYLRENWKQMYEPFEQELTGLFTTDVYFEFMAPNVDKRNALIELMPLIGVDSSEVMSFGDSLNDVGMIEWAGIGVAMGNAMNEVKASADFVTLTNNEDGIVHALKRYVWKNVPR